MDKYMNSNRVTAQHMTRGDYNTLRGWQLPENENALDDGFLVINHTVSERNVDGYDGYVSWLPTSAFHQQYKPIHDGMTFGEALEAVKGGNKVARSGWNGQNMFLLFVDGKCVEQSINEHYGNVGDPMAFKPVMDAIYMKTADNKLVPWLASQTDLLATDWEVVQ